MQFVPSTFLALAMIGALLAIGLRKGLWLVFATMPLGAAAAFNLPAVGNASFGIKELTVIAVFALVFARRGGPDSLLGTLRVGQPGAVLVLLYLWCAVSALWVPSLLEGATQVFTISRSANLNGIRSIPLGPGTGNITQLFALTISVLAFAALATHARLQPDPAKIDRAVALATGLNLALGLADIFSAAAGHPEVMDPLRTANYSILSEAEMMGLKRMIGGFPEASSFGSFSMGLLGYWLHRWMREPEGRLPRTMLLIALFCVLRATSSAAYVALVLFLGIYAALGGVAQIRRALSARAVRLALGGGLVVWFSATLIFAAYQLSDGVRAFMDATLFDKLASDSGVERMSWNAQALRNLTDTWLIGAGLGSARASNWLLSSLGSIGLIGTLLFAAFLRGVFTMKVGLAGDETAATVGALKWGCAATLVAEVLIASTPNIGVFFFALAGLATGLARSTQTDTAPDPSLAGLRTA